MAGERKTAIRDSTITTLMTDRTSPPSSDHPLEWLRWFLQTDHEAVTFVREVASSILLVLVIGLLLFAVSGVWPPMVAVESGSMAPHMQEGDLVFVIEEHRLAPSSATSETGVVTFSVAEQHEEYRKFGTFGDVIVYEPNGEDRTPVIHRARFWVDAGENWYDEANPRYLDGESCAAIPNCPAPHAGFITKGDHNHRYDQVRGISAPVRPTWVRGKAQVRIPWLGHVRLAFG